VVAAVLFVRAMPHSPLRGPGQQAKPASVATTTFAAKQAAANVGSSPTRTGLDGIWKATALAETLATNDPSLLDEVRLHPLARLGTPPPHARIGVVKINLPPQL